MGLGLVSRSRKEKQMAMLKANMRECEKNKESWVSLKI